ncbi:MAG TPA: hypothetical protein VHQ43_00145 [Solirubrobacterales bacterium]|jgi:cobalamin biosynthesis Mg chelatase CobN|nr:hypothetical protein [Solirubrobacterales bacterium]
MKTTALGIGSLAAIIAALALPAAATAEYLVPPSNSAVNQYTETYPTAGGQKQTGKGQRAEKHPAKVLGSRNAQQLDEQGADGRAAAKLAAQTAPQQASSTGASGNGTGGGQTTGGGNSATGGGASAGNGKGGEAGAQTPKTDASEGSSGLRSVLSQATGSSSSGALGLLLPLAILGAIAWSVLYLLRQRKRPTA